MGNTSSFKDRSAYDNYNNYRYCYDNGHDEWVAKASRCFDFWQSKQWEAGDRARLENANRPAFTFNKLAKLIRVMKGIQKALSNDVRFMPVQDADIAAAQVRDALWLHEQNMNHLSFVESEVWERGLIMSRGYYNVRVKFDDNFQGNVSIKPRRSQDVVLDPCIDSYDPDDWGQVYEIPWWSKQDIEREFGKHAANELTNAPMPDWYDYDDRFMAQRLGHLPYYNYSGMADEKLVRGFRMLMRQYRTMKRKDVFVDMQTGEISDIPTTWDRERISNVLSTVPGLGTDRRDVEIVRCVTSCENTVLKDEESIYTGFTVVPFFPEFVDGVSKGALEDLIDGQVMFNKVTSQEMSILNSSANGGYKLKRGSLLNMTVEELEEIGSRPGSVFELKEISDMEKIEPNALPAGHDRMSFKSDQIMNDLSGVSNQARGFAREDVANEAIMSNQAASEINFASWLSNLHRSKQLVARQVERCWKAYYTETRILQINQGSSFRPQMQSVTINQPTPEGTVANDISDGKFSTVLVPSPTRSALNSSDLKDLIMLRKELGIQIPDDIMVEASNVQDKLKIITRLTGDGNADAQAKKQQEAEQHQNDQELAKAKVAKEQSAAQLNEARAKKAEGEAGKDPDAAYREVEMARIASEHQSSQAHIAIDWAKLRATRDDKQNRTAMDITKLDHGAAEARKDRDHDMSKTKMQGLQRRTATKQPAAN